MKRRLILLSGLFGLVASASFIAAYVFMSDSINQNTYASIRKGMTEAEVIRLIGRPCDIAYPVDGHVPRGEAMIWNGKSGRICVCFLEGGAAERIQFDEHEDRNSVSRKIRRWLRIDPPMLSRFQAPTSGPMIFPDY